MCARPFTLPFFIQGKMCVSTFSLLSFFLMVEQAINIHLVRCIWSIWCWRICCLTAALHWAFSHFGAFSDICGCFSSSLLGNFIKIDQISDWLKHNTKFLHWSRCFRIGNDASKGEHHAQDYRNGTRKQQHSKHPSGRISPIFLGGEATYG